MPTAHATTPAAPVAIVGPGQMGLVLADALHAAGQAVCLLARDEHEAAVLRTDRVDEVRLPGFVLERGIEVTADPEALRERTVIIAAVPAQSIRAAFRPLRGVIDPEALVISAAKGIEVSTLLTPTSVLAEVLADGDPPGGRFAALSGPTVAVELARRLPATMVAASPDEPVAAEIQRLFDATPWLRIYRHRDRLGIELAGAIKNVIALAAGIIDGIGAGANCKSALLARGLAEMARLGTSLGAQHETFFGVGGVGDLATTCFSASGRNRSCGERLGRGESLDRILASVVTVVEGVPTTRAVRTLATRAGIEMPICDAVHEILFEGLEPSRAIQRLMNRRPIAEIVG